MKTKEYSEYINLKTRFTCNKLYSRLVWQKLFDLYRSAGGNLTYMDDMLCDLYSLERYFESGSFEVYWYFGCNFTGLQDFIDPDETCYKIKYDADNCNVTISKALK